MGQGQHSGKLPESAPRAGADDARKSDFSRLAPVVLILCFGIIMSVAGFVFVQRMETDKVANDFERNVRVYANLLQSELAANQQEIASVAGLYAASQTVDRREFSAFAEPILHRREGIQTVAWHPRVRAGEREAFERRAREAGFTDFSIWQRPVDGALEPATPRDVYLYFPVLFIEPSDTSENRRARGYYPLPDSTVRGVVERTYESGEATASGRLGLVAAGGDEFAVAIIQPIYRNGAAIDTVAERRAAMIGFVSGLFRVGDLVETTLGNLGPDRPDIYFYDISAETGQEFLYFHSSRTRRVNAGLEPEATRRTGLHSVQALHLAGRTWSAVFKPAPGQFVASDWQSLTVLLGGLMLTAFLVLYQRSILIQNVRVSRLVAERTGELAAAEERFSGMLDIADDGIISVGEDQRITLFNQGAQKIFGYAPEEVLGEPLDMLLPARFRSRHGEQIKEFAASSAHSRVMSERPQLFGQRKDGTEFPAEASVSKLVVGGRQVFTVTLRDITERAKAEEALIESERKYRDFVDGSLQAILIHQHGKVVYANPAAAELWQYDLEQLIGLNPDKLIHPNELDLIHSRRKQPPTEGHEGRRIKRDGTDFWTYGVVREVQWNGELARQVTALDVTELKQAEEALKTSEKQLRLITDNIPVLISYVDSSWRYRFVNRTFLAWHNCSSEDVIGKTIGEVFGEKRLEEVRHQIEPVLRGETQSVENTVTFADGKTRDLQTHEVPHLGSDGQILGAFNLAMDVTERKAAQAELRQAQKMEAIGHLTGGVAHDFNNILAIVLGNLELTEERLGTGDDVGSLLTTAIQATRRGADLTQRLLAYSRQQVLAPKAVNLGETVAGTAALLRSTLGAQIEIETVGDDDLWVCEVDVSQVENALLNLALNARDAMPAGGKLTIETANVRLDNDDAAAQSDVKPGDYVMLAVSDQGIGMSPEVLEQIYEPFFTTKGVGEGSGLGLSMIYGFVKQSGGHITVDSEVGVGSAFKIYLPRSDDPCGVAVADDPVGPDQTAREETVFVIEDDPDLRILAVDLLRSLGYRVMDAGSGAAALELLKQGRRFDLLLTDVILPGGMSGPDLAKAVQRERPEIKVLFMSGYTEMAMDEGGRLDESEAFLQKPFHRRELAAKVRQVLHTAA